MQLKKAFLIGAFVAVSIIALLYGISPRWFAATVLGNYSHTITTSAAFETRPQTRKRSWLCTA